MRVKITCNAIWFVLILLPVSLIGQQEMKIPKQPQTIKVVLVGDSTVAVQGGWGPGFCADVNGSVECLDLAANGRSTKSFIDEGLWAKALEARGQFYFIQFGHNDQKDQLALRTDPETSFKANLRRYVRDVREFGGTPILVTSLTRRNYRDNELIVDPLFEYAAATREVAAEEHIPLVDLYALSRAFLKSMTQQQADCYDAVAHRDVRAEGANSTTPDRTHLNDLGKKTFGDMVARAASQNVPALRPYITLAPSIEK